MLDEEKRLYNAMLTAQMEAARALLVELETLRQQMTQIVRRAKGKEALTIAKDYEHLINKLVDAVKHIGLLWLAERRGDS